MQKLLELEGNVREGEGKGWYAYQKAGIYKKKNGHDDDPLAKSPGPPGASYTVLPGHYTNRS